MASERPLSAIEKIKALSRSLRGTITEELHSSRPGFSADNARLLKFHGVIQHDNRDLRKDRRHFGFNEQFEFTLRVRPTGGKMTARQMLGLLDLVQQFRLEPLRLTSRQGIQLSHLGKDHLQEVIRQIANLGMTTFSSGGDVNCNVMCCPSPAGQETARRQLRLLSDQIATALMPDPGAYNEVWLADSSPPQSDNQTERSTVDHLYGRAYLPHKLKIGLAFPEDNCVDVYAQDIGLLAVCKGDHIAGYDMLVGGGLGVILSAPRSFRALAQPMAFVPSEDALAAVCAVMAIYRDFGDRTCRGKARLKYLIQRWGLDEFRQRVERQLGHSLGSPRGISVSGREDHLGWQLQHDGRWALGVLVESGRLDNTARGHIVTALREILSRFDTVVRLTPQQNLLLGDVDASSKCDIDAILEHHNILPASSLSGVRRGARSCPALPRCRNAITEAERIVPQVLAEMEAEMEKLGLAGECCDLCVTGCPSGCVRCYLADIALVGRTVNGRSSVDKFAIYVGGDHLGHRLNQLFKDLVPMHQVMPSIRPLLAYFKQDRRSGETLGEFFCRKGVEDLRKYEQRAS